MEIDITELVNSNVDLTRYSCSRHERGDYAGKGSYKAACEAPFKLLDTDKKKDAARHYLGTFGAWERSEIDAWTDDELNGVVLQLVSGDLREFLYALRGGLSEFRRYQRDVGGHIFRGSWRDQDSYPWARHVRNDRRWYYYLGE